MLRKIDFAVTVGPLLTLLILLMLLPFALVARRSCSPQPPPAIVNVVRVLQAPMTTTETCSRQRRARHVTKRNSNEGATFCLNIKPPCGTKEIETEAPSGTSDRVCAAAPSSGSSASSATAVGSPVISHGHYDRRCSYRSAGCPSPWYCRLPTLLGIQARRAKHR